MRNSWLLVALVGALSGCEASSPSNPADSTGSAHASLSAEGDRYIVRFTAGASERGMAALRAAGGQVLLSLRPQNAVAARLPASAVGALERNPSVEYVEIDQLRQPLSLWSDRKLGSGETLTYGVQMIQADLVTSSNEGAKKVCIIDSGYSQQHLDLKDDDGSATTDPLTYKAIDSGSGHWDQDSCGHGSHVAGTVLATANNGIGVIGTVPGARLHVVKVFGDDVLGGGNCSWTYSSTLVDALNQCTGAGANIVSMSLGGSIKSRTEEVAFGDADKNGVLSIAAAGNGGNTTTSYPAGYSSVVSVAAVDSNETVASFSQQNRDVEIAAPGVSVLSTVPWLETNTLSADGVTWNGGRIEGAARTNGVTAPIYGVAGDKCAATSANYSGKVVICQRGDISFADKVANVANSGGKGVVIYNNATSDATCGVFTGTLGNGVTSAIPAVGISCADGDAALTHVNSAGTIVSKVTTPDTGYEAWDGTSMATPHVSGAAALIWSCHPNRTNAEIRNAMNTTALDRGAAGRDNAYGYGIV